MNTLNIMKPTFLFTLMLLIAAPCMADNDVDKCFYIDRSKRIKEKNIFLQDVAKVEYIPLETTDDCLIHDERLLWAIRVTANDVFISVSHDILRFSRDGKFLNRIGKYGQGPREMAHNTSIAVDDQKKEVWVYDGAKRRFIVYDFEGNYIREIEHAVENFDFLDQDHFVCYESAIKRAPAFTIRSRKDGSVVKNLSYIYPSSSGITYGLVGRSLTPRKNKGEIFFNSYVTDTIFSTNNKTRELTPRYIFLPANRGRNTDECPTCVSPFLLFETEAFAYFVTRGKEMRDSENYYIIDKKNNTVYKGLIADSEASRPLMCENTGVDNQIIGLYYINNLVDRLESGRLHGRLKALTEGLNDDANPVLVIATFHE